jgi:hypothetical protein
LAAKAPVNNATMTGLTTVSDLKVLTGVSTDNPLGLVLGGSGVSTLGTLSVNCDTLITSNLTVNGPIVGYSMQSNAYVKASNASMTTLQANMENAINTVSTNTYTKTYTDTKLLKQVNYEHDIGGLLNTIKLNKIQAIDYNTNPTPLIDIQNNTRIVGTLNETNDLTMNNNSIINLLSGKNATLTSATAVGAQSILNVSTINV